MTTTTESTSSDTVNVYQDKDGNWMASHLFTFPSGAQGVEHVQIIKRSQNCFADAELRDEAEQRARALFGGAA